LIYDFSPNIVQAPGLHPAGFQRSNLPVGFCWQWGTGNESPPPPPRSLDKLSFFGPSEKKKKKRYLSRSSPEGVPDVCVEAMFFQRFSYLKVFRLCGLRVQTFLTVIRAFTRACADGTGPLKWCKGPLHTPLVVKMRPYPFVPSFIF